ncbi:hypothetical protein TRFO_16537 [Tritrichomonas foetus]|uniref:Thioredoxin domain-containing protein n=1 Tax=Tritrichomonas foetus TaxID=1144522 RepID=A0A1J4KUJ4_9EUKA|nr:hypothetical protein TRFO_16537 [Tritrichomonas foetus]|eukprot:OHT13334.1 hypothetical protein TRFO_16537 [Tritrichomonas foetus]
MIFIFFYAVKSIFQDFDPYFIDQQINNSRNVPIFIGFYLPDDPKKNFSLEIAKYVSDSINGNLMAYTVDCELNYAFCDNINVHQFPSFLVIHSPDLRFNVFYQGDYSFESIVEYVTSTIYVPVKVLSTISEIDTILEEETNSTIAVFYCNENDDDIAHHLTQDYASLGKKLYIIDSDTTKLDVYLSPFCVVSYSDSPNENKYRDFLFEHRYPLLHHVSYDEFTYYRFPLPFLLFVTEKDIKSEQLSLLSLLSQSLCNRYLIGFLNPTNDRRFNVTFQPKLDDPSYVAIVNREKNRIYKLLQPPTLENIRKFMNNITIFEMNESNDRSDGFPILVAFLALIIIILLMLLYYENYDKLLDYISSI